MAIMVARSIKMDHAEDPKVTILRESEGIIKEMEPMGSLVLLGVYLRPEKTKGGILITKDTQDEDRYQGKIALVLKMGPLAFKESETHTWGDNKPKEGDWVMYRVGDTFPFIVNERTYRFIEDVDVRAKWNGSPDSLI